MQYNKKTFGGDRLPYKSVKDGDGELGLCKETQCSEYAQNAIWENILPDMSRAEWNKKTGLHGDAWDIGKNIIKAGGRRIPTESVAPGDLVTIYTGGDSPSQGDADAAGTRTSHTGVIDQVNDDGSYVIVHNVHKRGLDGKLFGREFRNKVTTDGQIGGRWTSMKVADRFRPNTDGVKRATKPLRKGVELTIDPDKAQELQGINSPIGNATDKIQTFIKPLNDFRNKEKFSQIFDLAEDEYQSLAQLTIGIIGQETNFGTSIKGLVKEPIAHVSRFVSQMTDDEFSSSSNYIKGDEVSQGAGQLKYNTNFHGDLSEFGINKGNFDEDKNAPITSMYKLATDYKRYLSKGFSKKDSLYRAAAVYNASLQGKSNGKSREEWAQSYDVDYANKAIQFASSLGVRGEEKSYRTMIDDLLLEDNVRKWDKKAYSNRN